MKTCLPSGLAKGLVLLLGVTSILDLASGSTSCVPGLVDLGYAKHIPSYVATTSSGNNVTVYKNIRFAKPPIGNLRFRWPDTRVPKQEGIQNGLRPDDRDTSCISSVPAQAPYPGINGTSWGHEDCLFLDVWIPQGVKPGDKVPVLHWSYGSGFAFGSKEISASPIGLFGRMSNDKKFIFVVHNYRLGALGWTSVPGPETDSNVGMFDTLAAGEWISKYIGRFGGDQNRVTAIGQSAGAGMLSLLTTLRGGKGKLPFQQLFISSPAVPPRSLTNRTRTRQLERFQAVLSAANCTNVECLRSIPEEVIFEANRYLIIDVISPAGGGVLGPSLGFGPEPDGELIPDMPEISFEKGRYHKDIKSLIVGNMGNEGMGLSHDTGMPGGFPDLVRQILSTASNDTVSQIEELYTPYSDPAELAWDWTTDVIFARNCDNLANTFRNRTKRYIMTVPPATHGFDAFHYFYVNQLYTPVPNPDVAYELQRRLINFVHGNAEDWPTYGSGESIFNITASGFENEVLPANLKERYDVVSAALSDPANGV
ncbi:putative lipase 2 [Thozetella sp. PMI_491]|nr:putative lipase 2 [Thozetella sp. PMI_491]